MDLREALLRDEFVGLQDQEALDYGNTRVVTSSDHTPYTWSGVGAQLIARGVTPDDLIQLATNINTLPGGVILDKCLASGGFDFADPFNRATIESFEIKEPQWAVNILEAMLAIGETAGTRWQLLGVDQPTLDEITAERSQNTATKDWWAQLVYETIPSKLDKSSIAELKALIAGS